MQPVSLKTSAERPAQAPFWSLKPWWCQPWSILTTGASVIGVSWWTLHRLWISLPLSLAVVAWWLLFLVAVPAAYRAGTLGE